MQVEVPEDGSDMHTLSLPSCALTQRDIQALCYGLSFASLTSLDLSSVALGTQAQHQAAVAASLSFVDSRNNMRAAGEAGSRELSQYIGGGQQSLR